MTEFRNDIIGQIRSEVRKCHDDLDFLDSRIKGLIELLEDAEKEEAA